MEIKSPEELIKNHYIKWVMDQTDISEDEAKIMASKYTPQQSHIDAMFEFAAQFVDDPKDIMNAKFPSKGRGTIDMVSIPEDSSPYEIEKIMDEHDIHPDDVINIILDEELGEYTLFYHSIIIPKEY